MEAPRLKLLNHFEESYIQQKSQSKNEHGTFQFVCALVLCVALRPAQAMDPPPLARVQGK